MHTVQWEAEVKVWSELYIGIWNGCTGIWVSLSQPGFNALESIIPMLPFSRQRVVHTKGEKEHEIQEIQSFGTWYMVFYDKLDVPHLLIHNVLSRYQNELPGVISSREEPHLNHEELCKLMAWKLTVRCTCTIRSHKCMFAHTKPHAHTFFNTSGKLVYFAHTQ